VIGEGAIGASKTTVEMMGGRILEGEPIFLIMCILLVLVSLSKVKTFLNDPLTRDIGTFMGCIFR
jgi:hypothetical protein